MMKKSSRDNGPMTADAGPQSACHEQRFASARPTAKVEEDTVGKGGQEHA